MTPTVLFRQTDEFDTDELEAIGRHFPVYTSRAQVPRDGLVIPRYCALPFGKELETDVTVLGSRLINSFRQHCYAAELRRWYPDFEDLTPQTWFRLEDAGRGHDGPYVLKGSTNSKKFSWETHMFAPTFRDAGEVYGRLLEDGLISTQEIVVRKYVPLRNHGLMPTGLPISHEFRCFFFKERLISKAFYWSHEVVDPEDNVPQAFLEEVAKRGGSNIDFWVADVAQTEQGDWLVVELNDGCMSGLSRNDPDVLFGNLKTALTE